MTPDLERAGLLRCYTAVVLSNPVGVQTGFLIDKFFFIAVFKSQ